MGCCDSKDDAVRPEAPHPPANTHPSSQYRGHRLGGDVADPSRTPAELAAEAAARRRSAAVTPSDRARITSDQRAQLYAEIVQLYARLGEAQPFGLPSFSVEQLERLRGNLLRRI